MQAVERLVKRARELAAGWSTEKAITMYEAALRIDPSRGDLHVELAELELACGREDEGTARLEALASAYLDRNMVSEAEAIIAALEAHHAEAEPGAVVPAQTGLTAPMTVVLGVPQPVEVTHTEFCDQPVLLFPDGTPMPGQRESSPRSSIRIPRPRPNAKRVKPVQIVRLSAPALRRPKPVPPARPKRAEVATTRRRRAGPRS